MPLGWRVKPAFTFLRGFPGWECGTWSTRPKALSRLKSLRYRFPGAPFVTRFRALDGHDRLPSSKRKFYICGLLIQSMYKHKLAAQRLQLGELIIGCKCVRGLCGETSLAFKFTGQVRTNKLSTTDIRPPCFARAGWQTFFLLLYCDTQMEPCGSKAEIVKS